MILYTAPWCSQCKPVKSFIEKHDLPVREVNVDTINPQELNIRSLPTLLDEEKNEYVVGVGTIMAYLLRRYL